MQLVFHHGLLTAWCPEVCGIAGEISLTSSAPDLSSVERMTRTLIHRGPDGQGYLAAGLAALGHRRLSIVDLEHGAQPMSNESGDVSVVFNGEIYNAPTLLRQLSERGHRLASRCDTEVLVHLYEDRGPEMVHELRGMFAFAVWDSTRSRGIVARDRLGIKPLYYCATPGRLLFGSELKALLAHPDVGRELDPLALDAYLALHYIPAPLTIFRGVRKLPPGHLLEIDNGQVSVRRYWDVPAFGAGTSLPDEEAAARLRALLEESVEEHLLSDVPIGMFLSGGVDSSIVAAIAARQATTPLQTFCVRFDDREFDEGSHASLVARHIGTRHEEKWVRPDAIAVLPDLVRHYDEPFGDPSALPTYYVCQAAASTLKVCLSGDGGDELFAGYNRYDQSLSMARLDGVPRVVRRLGAGVGRLLLAEHMRGNGWVRRLAAAPAERYERLFDGFDVAGRRELLAAGRSAETGRDGAFFEPWLGGTGAGTDLLSSLQMADIATYLPECILTKVDRVSMAHSLEVRVPLLDHRVVEMAATLPRSAKIRDGRRKWILKRATEDLLPEGFLDRPKRGFSLPIRDWLRGDLGTHARQVLLGDRCRSRGLLRTPVVERLLDLHARGQRDFSTRIWSLLFLEHWCQAYLD
jgi:asparagine synthase (glutamine-hydrolysing)